MEEIDMYGKPVGKDRPTGIGGWLILPLIGLIGTLAMTAANLVIAYRDLSPELVGEIMRAATPQMETVRTAFVLSSLGGFAILGTAGSALYQFLRKRRSLPGSMIVHYLAVIAALGCELYAAILLDRLMPGEAGVKESWMWLARGIGGGAIWIAYFRVSQRVKNTFVT